jgi:hypothetical protein
MRILGQLLKRKVTKRTFADFAKNASHAKQAISLRLNEVNTLVHAIGKALADSRCLDAQDAIKKAGNALILICPKCGEYNENAKNIILLGGEDGLFESAGSVIFGGPKVAALAQGRCPGCQGQRVTAVFDPSYLADSLSVLDELQTILAEIKSSPTALEKSKEFYMQIGLQATADLIVLLYKAKVGIHKEDGLTPSKIVEELLSIEIELKNKEKEAENNNKWMDSESYHTWRTMLDRVWQIYRIATQ